MMGKSIRKGSFEWDSDKELLNIRKHGINFRKASAAFGDPFRKIATDAKHNHLEPRLFCIAKVNKKIVTVRFVYREGIIRIIGAGYWRKGQKFYDQEKK